MSIKDNLSSFVLQNLPPLRYVSCAYLGMFQLACSSILAKFHPHVLIKKGSYRKEYNYKTV